MQAMAQSENDTDARCIVSVELAPGTSGPISNAGALPGVAAQQTNAHSSTPASDAESSRRRASFQSDCKSHPSQRSRPESNSQHTESSASLPTSNFASARLTPRSAQRQRTSHPSSQRSSPRTRKNESQVVFSAAGELESAYSASAAAKNISASEKGAHSREMIKVNPQTSVAETKNGMTYRRGGGFLAVKQLAVVCLEDHGEESKSVQALITTRGNVRLPSLLQVGASGILQGQTQDPDQLETAAKPLEGFDFVRVPSNEWLNERHELFGDASSLHTDAKSLADSSKPKPKPGIHFLRNEEERVKSAQSGISSARPLSSSKGFGAASLDTQVSNLEKHINYLSPKPLLPEVYQQVHSISTIAPQRPQTPRLKLHPPTIPLWNPASPMSPARKFFYPQDHVKLPVVVSAMSREQQFQARTPRSPLRLSVGFQPGSPERHSIQRTTSACKIGREVSFDIEGLESRVHESRSLQEPAGLTAYSVHQSPRVSRFRTQNPPVGAGYASVSSPRPPAPGATITCSKTERSSGSASLLPLNSTTSFVMSTSSETLDHLEDDRETLLQSEFYSYARPSLRPAAVYRALDCEYKYVHVAQEAALARARQRQAYQDALVSSTSSTVSTLLKGIVDVVGKEIHQRELMRLKREAEERARLARETFERKCMEFVVVRVIKAINLPVDRKNEQHEPAPYIWLTTAPNSKKRGAKKVAAPVPKSKGLLTGLKKMAGAMGIRKAEKEKFLTEAFTEIGKGVKHVWDEEFTLMVDKVGDRTLRIEAVDDHLKSGRDCLGSLRIPVDSLSLGEPQKSKTGDLFQQAGEEIQEWYELSRREINRDEQELEMIVSLVEAKGLVAADKNGTSDPYCTLELGKQKFRSKTVKKTLDPKWGQAFKFDLGTFRDVYLNHQKVSLKEASSHLITKIAKKDVFGEIAKHGLAALTEAAEGEQGQKETKAGADVLGPAVLHISVLQAKDLIAADSGGTSDPYVRIHIGKEVANGKMTTVIKKNLNPVWNEHFEINIRENQRRETIHIHVFDKDVIGKDDSLGKFQIELDSLPLKYEASGDPLARWHDFDVVDGVVNHGQLQLTYELVKRTMGQTQSKKAKTGSNAITLRVWDYDMGGFGTDDFLGQVVIPLNFLEPDETCDRWFDLQERPDSKGKDVVSGQVRLKVMCRIKKDANRPLSPTEKTEGRILLQVQRVKELREAAQTELALTVKGAQNLHLRLDSDDMPDALALVSLDGRKVLTDAVLKDENPLWESDFLFDTIRLQSKLHVTLFDSLPNQHRRFLGRVEMDVSKLQVGKPREEKLQLIKGNRIPEDHSSSSFKNLQILVRLLEAKDILAADRGGTSDPYATLEVDNQKLTSKVQKKTLKPKWRETFRFQLGAYPKHRSEEEQTKNRSLWKKARKKNAGRMSLKKPLTSSQIGTPLSTLDRPSSSATNVTTNTMLTNFSDLLKGVSKTLTVALWDHDIGPNPDDFLGVVVLPLDLVSDGDEFEDWFELRPGQDKSQVTGLVKLGLKVTEEWDPEPVSGAVSILVERISMDVSQEEIVVEVLQARDLQAADRCGTSDPFAILSFHGPQISDSQAAKSQVVHKTLNPVWDEMFILGKERGARNLIVDIFDYDRIGSNDFLGRAFVPMDSISDVADERWLPLLDKEGKKDTTGSYTGELQVKVKRRPLGSVHPEEIYLHVIEAKGLMAADRSGTSDPFAVIGFEGSSRCGKKVKTKVIPKTLAPVWDERFELDVDETAKRFVLDVFDDDILGANDFLGRVMIPMPEIVQGQAIQRWFPLSALNDDCIEEQEELVVHVIKADGIKAADRGGTSDPFAVVALGGGSKRIPSQKTKTVYKTLNPEWNESFVMSLDSHPDELFVDIFDYDLVGMNDFLGRAKVRISSLEPDCTIEEWHELGYKTGQNASSQSPGNGAIPAPGMAGEAPSTGKDGEEMVDGSDARRKKGIGDILQNFSDKMHRMIEKGMDLMRGPEEGITGSVLLKITRRPRDLGSIHLKLSRRDREPFTRVIVVEVLAGRNLLAADKSGTSDPYVTLLLDGSKDKKKLKTRAIPKNRMDPEWNETFRIPTRGSHVGSLLVEVFDHDTVGKHQPLGAATMDLEHLLEDSEKVVDEWVLLNGEYKKLGPATGDIRLRVSMELEEAIPPAPAPNKRKLQVVVKEARDLEAADSSGTSDPFAVVRVSGVKSARTKIIKKTLNPAWKETFELILPAGNQDPLEVQIFDHDQFGSNDFLGEIIIPLDVLDIGQVVDKWYDLEPRENRMDIVSGSIHLQVTMSELDT